MLLKKSTVALCPCSGVLSAVCAPFQTSPPCRPWSRHLDALSPRCSQQHRLYASVHNGEPRREHKGVAGDQFSWPTSPNPTPYEILGLARDAPYHKGRYFELAKLYHPDRHQHTSGDGIPQTTKLERYRLVVAANDILSNPQKRRMYDLYGIGWGQHTDPLAHQRAVERTWRQQPGNASMNATWEDWERWHQRKDGEEKQEPIFTSNGGFAAIIALFLLLGTWGQVTMAGANSINLLDMRDEKHAIVSQALRQRQSEVASLNRAGRIENFLRQRESERWAYDPPGHGVAEHHGVSSNHG